MAAISGLDTLMSSLGLEDKAHAAAKWCQVHGAESVQDLIEEDYAEQLVKELDLPQIKAKKLVTAIKGPKGSSVTASVSQSNHVSASGDEEAIQAV